MSSNALSKTPLYMLKPFRSKVSSASQDRTTCRVPSVALRFVGAAGAVVSASLRDVNFEISLSVDGFPALSVDPVT